MTTDDTALSKGLQALVNDFSVARDYVDGVSMDQKDLHKFLDILTAFQALATNLEIEVRCHRDMEDGKQAKTFLDEQTVARVAEILPSNGGTIIRPNFGGRK